MFVTMKTVMFTVGAKTETTQMCVWRPPVAALDAPEQLQNAEQTAAGMAGIDERFHFEHNNKNAHKTPPGDAAIDRSTCSQLVNFIRMLSNAQKPHESGKLSFFPSSERRFMR